MPIIGIDDTDTKRTAEKAWMLRGGSRIEIPHIWIHTSKYGRYDVLNDAIPPLLIIMYRDDTSASAAGATISEHAMPYGKEISKGESLYTGSNDHDGSEHGSDTPSVSNITNYKNVRRRTVGASGYRAVPSHGHPTSAHTHTSDESVHPRYFGLVGSYNSPVIKSGAFFMFESAISLTDWVRFTDYMYRYLRLMTSQSSITIGGSSYHAHDNVSDQTGAGGSVYQESYKRNKWFYSHNHYIESTMANADNAPPYYGLMFYEYVGLDIKYNSQIPEGAIGWYLDSTPPKGWAVYEDLLSRFVRNDDVPRRTGGSSTHTHSAYNNMTGAYPFTSYEYQETGDYYAISQENHPITDGGHGGTGNSLPRRIQALPVIKY